MAAPVLLVEYTTDDPDDTTPTWTDVTELVRSFDTNRGRDNELSRVEAGTATIVLNNLERDFDPTNDATLRPMNRWRISAVLDTGTEEIFTGYAESYEQQWPATGIDAVTVVSCADEFKVLALDKLPTTDPPRDTYQDVMMYDTPSAYWPLLGPDVGRAVLGDVLLVENSAGSVYDSLAGIVGQNDPGYAYLTGTGYLITNPFDFGAGEDPTSLAEFTIDFWLAIDGTPASTETIIRGPLTNTGENTWRVEMNTSRQLMVKVRNSGATAHTVTSTTALTSDSPFDAAGGTWYHVVGTITGGNLRLYINGTQEASTAWTGVIDQIEGGGAGTGSRFIIGNLGIDIGANVRAFDEVAFYKSGLTAARVLAHYEAGQERGFPRFQEPGDRVEAVLDSIGSTTDRNVQTGTNNMTGAYMAGQAPLEVMREAETAENVDALLFIAKDGTITFLADGHRSSSPYNTVQATFSDDGSELPYNDLQIDYSDSYLYNEVTATRVGGELVTDSDSTSITAFLKRTLSVASLPITTDGDVTAIAAALLDKYKDPMSRITALELRAREEVAEAVLPLDIGHRIRVIRNPPSGLSSLYGSGTYGSGTYGGSVIDQTLFIQRIAVSGDPREPWRIRLGVSPL